MLDEELKQLLRKNLEVSEESLKILRKMRRAALMGRFFSFLKWVIIIGISVGAYYYIEPYLKIMTDTFSTVTSGPDLLEQIPNFFPPK